jgi:hypothetical protein
MFFVLLQALRVWVLATRGPYWTTVITVPGAPLVNRGPGKTRTTRIRRMRADFLRIARQTPAVFTCLESLFGVRGRPQSAGQEISQVSRR